MIDYEELECIMKLKGYNVVRYVVCNGIELHTIKKKISYSFFVDAYPTELIITGYMSDIIEKIHVKNKEELYSAINKYTQEETTYE